MCQMWTRAEYKTIFYNACGNLVTHLRTFLFKFPLKNMVHYFGHSKTKECLNLFMYVLYTYMYVLYTYKCKHWTHVADFSNGNQPLTGSTEYTARICMPKETLDGYTCVERK